MEGIRENMDEVGDALSIVRHEGWSHPLLASPQPSRVAWWLLPRLREALVCRARDSTGFLWDFRRVPEPVLWTILRQIGIDLAA